MNPLALVLRAPGTNCDAELCRAFRLAGADVDLVHIDALVNDPARLERYGIIAFPGGFSYGDDIASGRIFAARVAEKLYPGLRAAAERGAPIIGVCNGFQVLVQVGLLPGPVPGQPWPQTRPPQTAALAHNDSGRFIDRWVRVVPEANSVCLWTRGLSDAWTAEQAPALAALAGDVMRLPIAHGEGRFTAAGPEVVEALGRHGQIALRYGEPVNGSEADIAGICDATGRIFGLMPHPERYLEWTRHPYWTRLPEALRAGGDSAPVTPGRQIFLNAVHAAREAGLVAGSRG